MNHKASLRIFHLLPGRPYGGMQRLVAWLASEQLKQGLDVLVISYTGSKEFNLDLQNRHIPFVLIDNRNPVVRIFRLMALIKKGKPDALHLHVGLLAVSLACLLAGEQPCIGHFHTYPNNKTIKLRCLNLINKKLCKTFIGVSKSMSDSIEKILRIPGSNIHTIYNGIEVKATHQSRDGVHKPPKYGMAARLVDDKGVLDFIHIAEKILAVQPDANFYIAGEGPLRSSLERLIRNKNLDGKIKLCGHVNDMEKFWCSLDIDLFLSKIEPFGLVILEAMDAGTPVIAFLNGSGSDEIVLTYMPEYCVEPGKYIDFANKCISLTTNQDLWMKVSHKDQHICHDNFSIQKMAKNIINVYQHIKYVSI